MIGFIITIIKLLCILGVVATIHELGHFLAAKFFKIGVEEFAIGFGPKIFQKEYKGTKYSLRWLPLGGFCAIEGEERFSNSETSYTNKSAWKKVIVLSMGVIFNVILSVLIFLIVALNSYTSTTKIEEFSNISVLSESGVNVGDKIKTINGNKIIFASDLNSLENIKGSDLDIKYVNSNNEEKSVTLKNVVKDIGYIGATFVVKDENKIDLIASGGAANKAGLKAGDVIISINDVVLNNPSDIVEYIRSKPNETLNFKIKRGNEEIQKEVKTEVKKSYDLGIKKTEVVKTNIPMSFSVAYKNVETIVGSYIDLFKGKVALNDMSGIVGIGEIVSKTNGFLEFFNLMAIICLAVGVANIMPFPPLDGGKIVIVICESIVRRKISEKVELIISYIGFALLIVITLLVTYNDIVRIL